MFRKTGFSRLRFYLGTKSQCKTVSATTTSGAYELSFRKRTNLSAGTDKRPRYVISSSSSDENNENEKVPAKRHDSDNMSELDGRFKSLIILYCHFLTQNLKILCQLIILNLKLCYQFFCLLLKLFLLSLPENSISRIESSIRTSTVETTISSSLHETASTATTESMEDGSSGVKIVEEYITLHRGRVMEELLHHFLSPCDYQSRLTITMIALDGKVEAVVDDGGVLRDSLSEYWTEFYNTCTLGATVKVPFIRHDYCFEKWKSVARCLLKGYVAEKYFPIKLALPFVEQCFFGCSTSDLTESFLNYVGKSEAELIKEAMKNISAVDFEELLEILTNYDCKTVPNDNNIKSLIEDIAHKELIQKPMFVINAWNEILNESLAVETLSEIYSKLEPTAKNVLAKTKCKPNEADEINIFNFVKKFIRDARKDELSRFLRFCTGADQISEMDITIEFNNQTGLCRAPSAHTCSGMLEVPKSYNSYPEFRNEINNVLNSNIWIMDSI